jgi:phage baseplate assembly protein V
MSAMKRMVAPLARRVQMMVGRAVIAAVNDGAKLQALQIELLADEVQDEAERFQNYGFSGVPRPGAECIVVFPGGLRSHGVVIAADDRASRPTSLQPGDTIHYDDRGQRILLTEDGILVESPVEVRVVAPSAKVEADSVVILSDDIHLGGTGGARVARIGDTVAGGVITGGSTKVRAA